MPYYNLTQLQESFTLPGLLDYVNTSTSQVFSGAMMLAIFFIMLLVLKKWEFEKSFTVTSAICFILSIILSYAQWLNNIFMFGFLILTASGVLWLYLSNK